MNILHLRSPRSKVLLFGFILLLLIGISSTFLSWSSLPGSVYASEDISLLNLVKPKVGSGDKQVQIINTAAHDPLCVYVKDAEGNPLAGKKVYFFVIGKPQAKKKNGLDKEFQYLSTPVAESDSKGKACTGFNFGSNPGKYTIIATTENMAEMAKKPVTFHLTANHPRWLFFLAFMVLGGLGMFIYGMDIMGDGLQKWAGDRMRTILGALTRNRVLGLAAGLVVTAIIQSSSATTVMLVGFVNAGLMNLAQSMGVILGADIGTTVTAQLIAFKVTDYALLMVGLGFILIFFTKKPNLNYLGKILLGFGLLFYGLKVMSDTLKPLRSYPPFLNVIASVGNPFVGLLIATVFTAIIQSSSAMTGIVITLAWQGLIGLQEAIPLLFGANLGTCVTAALASIGTIRDSKRVALAHTIFKLAGIVIFLPWYRTFGHLIATVSIKYFGADITGPAEVLQGAGDLTAMSFRQLYGFLSHNWGPVQLAISSLPRAVANAHTSFNVIMALIFLPITGIFATMIIKILPAKKAKEERFQPKYLTSDLTATPELALEQTEKEMGRLADIATYMGSNITEAFKRKDQAFVETLIQENNKVDILVKAIRPYLAEIGSRSITESQSQRAVMLMNITNEYGEIGRTVSQDILPSTAEFIENNLFFSPAGWSQLQDFDAKVAQNVKDAGQAFKEGDTKLAEEITERKPMMVRLEKEYTRAHFERLSKGLSESVETSTLHMEVISGLRRVNSYATNIAYALLGQV